MGCADTSVEDVGVRLIFRCCPERLSASSAANLYAWVALQLFAALQIELEPDPWKVVGAEGQCLVQSRQPGRDLPEICEGAPAHASAGGAVAHLAQVAGMRKHKRPVDEVEHVELEHVAAELDRELEGRERVLGR